jgi:hypothetical protein
VGTQVALERVDVEPVLLANLRGLGDHDDSLGLVAASPSYCIPRNRPRAIGRSD